MSYVEKSSNDLCIIFSLYYTNSTILLFQFCISSLPKVFSSAFRNLVPLLHGIQIVYLTLNPIILDNLLVKKSQLPTYYDSTTTISGVVPPLLECGCTHCFVCIYSRDFFLFKSSSSYLDRSTFPRQTTNWILTYIKLVRY